MVYGSLSGNGETSVSISEIKAFLLDAPLAPSGLFGDSVNTVVERFQETNEQSEAFKHFLPCRNPSP